MTIENVTRSKKHILEIGPLLTKEIWYLWLKLGVNFRPLENPPVFTEFPEIVVLRGVYLKDLAIRTQPKTFAEIGTARGWQSMLWAQYLLDKRVQGGKVYTCDIDNMDKRIYKTPLTGDQVLSRHELWEEFPAKSLIHFSHRPIEKMSDAIKENLDMIYIDGEHSEDAVIADFTELLPFITEKTIIVFDDCDERFPGVQKAVTRIAEENGVKIEIVTFEPHQYKIALMNVGQILL